MAVLYTPEEIQGVLRTLRIKPKDGMVSTQEAAKILTWWAREEQGVDFEYSPSSVRRHIQLGNLKPEPESTRFSLTPSERSIGVIPTLRKHVSA